MRHLIRFSFLALCIAGLCLAGCGSSGGTSTGPNQNTVQFTGPGVGIPLGTINGQVIDFNTRNPIAGATVTVTAVQVAGQRNEGEVLAQSPGEVVGTTITDANGNFSINVVTGTHDITVTLTGFITQIRPNVTVAANETVTIDASELTLQLMDGLERGVISGILINEFDRTPFAGATLRLRPTSQPATTTAVGPNRETTANPVGSFQFNSVVPDEYVLVAIAGPNQPRAIAAREFGPFRVVAGQETVITFENILTLGQGWLIRVNFVGIQRDYDSHSFAPLAAPFHVNFRQLGSNTQCPFIRLNADDITGGGTELTEFVDPNIDDDTISPRVGTYHFGVDDFSNTGANIFFREGITVDFISDLETRRFNAPEGNGLYWDVLRVTWDGMTHTVIPAVGTNGDIIADEAAAAARIGYAVDSNAGCP